MTHDEMREIYELYALGILESAEREEIDAHLARSCPECAAGVRRALETNAVMAGLAEEVSPQRRLRKRVLAAAGVSTAGPRWSAIWALAAACLTLAILIIAVRMRGELEETRGELRASNAAREEARSALRSGNARLTRLEDALRLLNEPETVQATFGGGGALPPSGRIFVNPSRGVLLIASHLPPAPQGRIYEMWIVPKKGAPAPAGLFQSDAQGNAVHLLAGPVDRAQAAAIAVTEEPASGSAAPTTKPFIVAALPTHG